MKVCNCNFSTLKSILWQDMHTNNFIFLPGFVLVCNISVKLMSKLAFIKINSEFISHNIILQIHNNRLSSKLEIQVPCLNVPEDTNE